MSRMSFEFNPIYEIAYHVNKGPTIVYIDDMLKIFKTTSISEACFLLSDKTERYVDYYIATTPFRRKQVRLELEQ